MKCTKCQFENPNNAKFCIECGAPIEFHCPQCGAMTPGTGKFCMDCGHRLSRPAENPSADISFDEKIKKIKKYLPEGITEKILSQRDRIEGERKHVTVLPVLRRCRVLHILRSSSARIHVALATKPSWMATVA